MAAKATAERILELSQNYAKIAARVTAAATKHNRNPNHIKILPVSKWKPASDIQALYDNDNLRHFGENYAQELVEKAQVLPEDIQWHFIGALQSNKIKDVAGKVKNLYSVESLSEEKKIKKLNDSRQPNWPKVNVFLQINTSSEEQKSGLSYDDKEGVLKQVEFITNQCENLIFKGFMTIGSIEQSKRSDSEENQDFKRLVELKQWLAEQLKLANQDDIELSMGMSSDFEEAIRQGTSYVRIGTNIFGARDYSGKK